MRVRSYNELVLWMALHPCERCRAPAHPRTLREDPAGGEMRYHAVCKSCGRRRELPFTGPLEWPNLADPYAYGDDRPSEVITIDEFRRVADQHLAQVAADPEGLEPEAFFAGKRALASAIAALAEVAKLTPPGSERERVEARVAELRIRKRRWDALTAQANARLPAPVATPFDRTALEAHRAWLARGRRGDGRLVAEGSDLARLRLGDSKLAHARLVRCRLDHAYLDFADLTGAELIECSAVKAVLTHAVLDGAHLERCRFEHAELGLTDLRDAVIDGGDFRGAIADRGAWNRLRATRVDFRDAFFGDCVLDGAVFEDCDLRGADLSRVNPALGELCSTFNTTFRRCDLRGARLEGRRLDGTRFIDCRLAKIRGTPLVEGNYIVERPDFSAAGDGSEVRDAGAVHAMWGKPRS